MNLLQLKYFQQLAKDENFTKAAQTLYVSQPALSQMISRLEEEIGIQLFYRFGKRIRLNKNGELFLEYVNRALHEINTGLDEISKIKSRDSGEISFSSMCSIRSLNKMIVHFKKQFPDLKLKYNMCNASISEKAILNYEMEFAINNRIPEDSRLEYTLLHTSPVFACLGTGHPLKDKTTISICDLKPDSFICNEVSTDRYETERICKKYGFSPDIAIECNDPRLTSAILNIQPYTMLLTSPGLQHRVLNPDIYTDTIVSFCEPVSSSLYVIRRKKHHFSSVAEKFYQYICEEIKNDCVQSESLLSDYFAVNSKPNPPQQAADMT